MRVSPSSRTRTVTLARPPPGDLPNPRIRPDLRAQAGLPETSPGTPRNAGAWQPRRPPGGPPDLPAVLRPGSLGSASSVADRLSGSDDETFRACAWSVSRLPAGRRQVIGVPAGRPCWRLPAAGTVRPHRRRLALIAVLPASGTARSRRGARPRPRSFSPRYSGSSLPTPECSRSSR